MDSNDSRSAAGLLSPDDEGGILRITLDDVQAKDTEPDQESVMDDGILRLSPEEVQAFSTSPATASATIGSAPSASVPATWGSKPVPWGEGTGIRGFLEDLFLGGSVFAVSAVGGGIAGFVLGFLIAYGYLGIPWGLNLGRGGLLGVCIVLFFASPLLIPLSTLVGVFAGIAGLLLGLLLGALAFLILLLTRWLPNQHVRAALIVCILVASGAVGIHCIWQEFFRVDPEFGIWFTALGGFMGLVVGLLSCLTIFREPVS